MGLLRRDSERYEVGKGHRALYSCHKFASMVRQCFLPLRHGVVATLFSDLCRFKGSKSASGCVVHRTVWPAVSRGSLGGSWEFSSWISSQLGVVTLRSASFKKKKNHWAHEPVKRDLMISHVVFVSPVCIYCSLLWPTKISRRRKNRLLNNLTGEIWVTKLDIHTQPLDNNI